MCAPSSPWDALDSSLRSTGPAPASGDLSLVGEAVGVSACSGRCERTAAASAAGPGCTGIGDRGSALDRAAGDLREGFTEPGRTHLRGEGLAPGD